MRKIKQFTVVFSLIVVLGCSTNNDTNGNSTTTVVPVVPSNLIGAVASTTQINLSWTDHSTSETNFKIERKTGSGTYSVIGATATDVTTFSNTGLTPSTTYTYRVYSNNTAGNSLTYSNELTLRTSATILLPSLTTTAVSAITNTTASTGGTISSDGGAAVMAKGVVWSTSANPTIALPTKTNNGTGVSAFASAITGLTTNTTYYIRAYATNSIGTAYGNQVSFITNPTINLPTITTTQAGVNISNIAIGGGTVSSDGGATVTARGVVWSTVYSAPTIALSTKTTDGVGIGTFTSTITGLAANTTYFYRAYATNSAGTAYGGSFLFQTGPIIITDIDGNYYETITFFFNCNPKRTWMKTNLNVSHYRNGDVIPQVTDPVAWKNLTTGAWCYYANSTSYGTTYGKLYNWYAVNDPRGLAPIGYHIPTYDEWSLLAQCGSTASQNIGGELKETGTAHWNNPNTAATNSTGFTGLPGSSRSGTDGAFESDHTVGAVHYLYGIGQAGIWWSSTEYGTNTPNARAVVLASINGSFGSQFTGNKTAGYSVRCIKD